MYNEIINNNITGEVKNFVSNITTSREDTKENIKTPEIIESTVETISPNDDNINYKNENINRYFYNQLDNYSKIIYNAIESNKENMKTGTYEINLGTEFSELLSKENGEELLGEYYQAAIDSYGGVCSSAIKPKGCTSIEETTSPSLAAINAWDSS